MGVDLVTLGVKHRLHANDPLLLCKELSEIHHVNIEVTYLAYIGDESCYDDRVRINETICVFQNEHATETAELRIPACDFLNDLYKRDHCFEHLDWHSEAFRNSLMLVIKEIDDENGYVFSYSKGYLSIDINNLILNSVDPPFRFYTFVNVFYRLNDFPSYLDLILDFRKVVKKECDRYGCEIAILYADSGDDFGAEFCFHTGDTKEELLQYLEEKRFIDEEAVSYPDDHLDVALEKSNDIVLNLADYYLAEEKPDYYRKNIHVMIDDFKDLK